MNKRKSRLPVESPQKGVYDPMDLVELGFGTRALIYKQVKNGGIPSYLIGTKRIIPGTWVHRRMGLEDA